MTENAKSVSRAVSNPPKRDNAMSGSGGDFLTRKSGLTKDRGKLTDGFKEFLIIDDNAVDARVLKAVLHVMFGYDVSIRTAKTLGAGLDEILANAPDVIFLDDILPPSDTALDTIPIIRKCDYAGPIIIISGLSDRDRMLKLRDAGASHVIHKDDIDSVSVGEALTKIQ